jgi:chloramphenicol 3-O phosphotransferase
VTNFLFDETKKMIILLNGASSAGKSSIAQELQIMFDELFLSMGCDKFMSMVPANIQMHTINDMWTWNKSYNAHGELMKLNVGQRGKTYILAMYECIELMAHRGFNIIVDDVCLDIDLLKHIATTLSSCDVYFIGVYCQLPVLEERERLRGNRVIHSARGQYEIVNHCYEYDTMVDTTETSAHDCALHIKTFIDKNPKPKAFKRLAMMKE